MIAKATRNLSDATYPSINYEAIWPELEGFAANVFSQFGEDGLIARTFELIGTTNKQCFEFGAADGVFCSNTRALCENGWRGVWIEPNKTLYTMLRCRKPLTVGARMTAITPENVDRILKASGLPAQPDLGVIDVDGSELAIWQAMIEVQPRVMLIEHFDEDGGEHLQETIEVGRSLRYRPLAVTFCNTLLGKDDLFDD